MLDYGDCEPFQFQSDGWRRARKEHRCSACREIILRGDRYWYHTGLLEGDVETTKHCARCHLLFDHLMETSGSGEGPDLFLDCGHTYEETHGEAPPDGIAALAFMTRAEAQAIADAKSPAPDPTKG